MTELKHASMEQFINAPVQTEAELEKVANGILNAIELSDTPETHETVIFRGPEHVPGTTFEHPTRKFSTTRGERPMKIHTGAHEAKRFEHLNPASPKDTSGDVA